MLQHEKYDVGTGEQFDDLIGLIEHCRTYPMVEASGDVLRLLQPISTSLHPKEAEKLNQEEISVGYIQTYLILKQRFPSFQT